MGCDPQQDPPLPIGLENQLEIAGFQIAQAAVHQPAGAGAGAGAEIVLIHQHDPEASHGRVAGHAGAGDPPADHQDVGRLRGQLFQRRPL